jgi:hypothetical protein
MSARKTRPALGSMKIDRQWLREGLSLTGRAPSSPALQNISIRTETSRALREALLGPPPLTLERARDLRDVFDAVFPQVQRAQAMRETFERFYGKKV